MRSPPDKAIRVLVVDDEAPARQRLTDLLGKHQRVGPVLEAADGRMALDMIQAERPDLVFLDVQMPELTGMAVLDAIGTAQMPLTIFVTAYDQHAVRAFEANALDYLLKPFSDERFEVTMLRAESRLNDLDARELGRRMFRTLSMLPAADPYLDRLVVKSAGTTQFIRASDIDWIEAAGVYVNLHVAGKAILYRASLQELADRLDPLRFIRVHRSAIVNIDSVVRLEPISHGEFDVLLKHGARARVSRTYRPLLEKRLGQTL